MLGFLGFFFLGFPGMCLGVSRGGPGNWPKTGVFWPFWGSVPNVKMQNAVDITDF
jgi:hypothetical protein